MNPHITFLEISRFTVHKRPLFCVFFISLTNHLAFLKYDFLSVRCTQIFLCFQLFSFFPHYREIRRPTCMTLLVRKLWLCFHITLYIPCHSLELSHLVLLCTHLCWRKHHKSGKRGPLMFIKVSFPIEWKTFVAFFPPLCWYQRFICFFYCSNLQAGNKTEGTLLHREKETRVEK
jgi:hypothetical protein